MTALTARPDGHGAGAVQSASPTLSGYKDVCVPRRFFDNPLHFFYFSFNCPVRPPSCLRPRWAPPTPADARSPAKEYDAASEKNAALPQPALGRATFPLAASPRPSDRGPTPESDADAVPGPSRSPATCSRDGLRCSFSASTSPLGRIDPTIPRSLLPWSTAPRQHVDWLPHHCLTVLPISTAAGSREGLDRRMLAAATRPMEKMPPAPSEPAGAGSTQSLTRAASSNQPCHVGRSTFGVMAINGRSFSLAAVDTETGLRVT